MKLIVIILFLLGLSSSTLADQEDLTKFGNRVYDLMTSANIFDKLFSLPADPKDTEKLFYEENFPYVQYKDYTDYVTIRRIADAAKDYFNGKFTAYKNFKAEMHVARFYLNYKGLLTDENTDFYAQMYFNSQKAALDSAEFSGLAEKPSETLTKGDGIFYGSFELPDEEVRLTMVYYADEMENIRDS